MPGDVILAALRRVWVTLDPQVPMAVMGGLALATWGHVRSTQDVDLLVGLQRTELDAALRQLRGADFRNKHNPPLRSVNQQDIVQLLYDPPGAFCEVQVDLLLVGGRYQSTALQRRVSAKFPGLDVAIGVLSREDMILHKLLAGRILDHADAAVLLRENRDLLDMSYLRLWLDDLRLSNEFAIVWREAFPDDPLGTNA